MAANVEALAFVAVLEFLRAGTNADLRYRVDCKFKSLINNVKSEPKLIFYKMLNLIPSAAITPMQCRQHVFNRQMCQASNFYLLLTFSNPNMFKRMHRVKNH